MSSARELSQSASGSLPAANQHALPGLIRRVESASGPDRELDEAIACYFAEPHPVYGAPVGMIFSSPVTASLDMAVALAERVLGRTSAEALVQSAVGSSRHHATLQSAFACAVLAALLKELAMSAETDGAR